MKVKWNKCGDKAGFGYFAGAECEMEEKQAIELSADGFVTILPESNTLPADLPARDLLTDAGVTDLSLLKQMDVDDLTALKGIGKATAEKIVNFLNK